MNDNELQQKVLELERLIEDHQPIHKASYPKAPPFTVSREPKKITIVWNGEEVEVDWCS